MTSSGVHTGRAMPLRVQNVDTDQIIPARFCTNTEKTGFADALFADWRAQPDFALGQPPYDGADVLVAAENFGTGSSREAAVWALSNYGFRAVVSPRFGDIFRNNAWQNGLMAITAPANFVEALWEAIEQDPQTPVVIDLGTLRVSGAGRIHTFALDADTQDRLLRGFDPIEATLQHEDGISAYERAREPTPTTRETFAAASRGLAPTSSPRPTPCGEAMSPEDTVKELYRRIDSRDFTGLASLFSEDAVYHRPGCEVLLGRAEIETFYQEKRTIDSGVHTLERILVSDGAVTADGSFSGRLVDGRKAAHRFAEIFEFTADGRFSRRDSFMFVPSF